MSCHQSLSRHKKACKQNINRKPSEHICNACGKQFPRRYLFIAHIKKCTGKRVVNYGVGKISCPYENCKNQYQFKVDLYEHLYTEHKADLKPPEIRIFESYKDFEKWKTNIEDESFSYFAQQYGKRNGRSYFYCQHDGSKKSHLQNQQPNKTTRKNKKGRIKKNDLCLAMMSLKYLPDGKMKVAYRPTHLHPCRPQDLQHQPLSTSTNEYISKLLAWNVPPRKIVQNLRDDSYKRANRLRRSSIKLKRDNLVKIKTITERMRKKNSSLRFSNDDAESVYFKVMILMKEEYNPILIYKPKGEKTVIGPEGSEHLPQDVFLLAFQTKEQLEMMVEGCKEILAIDETHSTNPYDRYQLLNMMVRDKFNRGYPVGHAISSRSDEAVLQFVFKAIKERCPDLKINCCITDDDPTLINAVNAGFGEAVWHLLCVWHIHRTIQSNIREHVKDSDLVSEIYSIMCVLIDEPDECQFLKLKDSFLLEYSHKCPTFKDYFNKTFLPKARKWAKCYRLDHHGETETTMLVESFHNILKTVYMKRRPNKRLDDLVDLLLTIEEDYYTRYTNAILLNSMSDKDYSDLSKRHLKGMEINDSDVTQISQRCWTVRSQDKNSTEEYIVVRCADQCLSDSCIFNCCYCDTLCSHLFTCSCPDIFPLCKHLHKLFSIIAVSEPDATEEKEPEFFTAAENTETVDNETVGQSHENHEERSFQRRIEAIRKIMQDLDNKFLDTSPVKRLLPRIENTFRDIQTQCEVLCEDPVIAVTEMDVKSKTAPNEKLKKQLKPFEKKSRKRKKTGLQKPNRRSVTELKDFLLHEQEEEENVDADLSDHFPQFSNEQTSDKPVKADDTPLFDIVLEYEGIKISSLHLKALHPDINSTELPSLLRADPKFVHGYLYDEVINVYLKLLCAENVNMYACDTTVALRLCSGKHDFKNFSLKLSSKSVILFPGNLDDKHWVIIAVEVSTCSMLYYNSLSSPESLLSPSERKFLSAAARLLRDVFPLVKAWSVKRHFDLQNKRIL
ncbi:Zinc finger and BTB domain-containing protein 11 [Frankliniella fusca]|uniref:Zinc finger and BTB domain-containing protein 11 n=1 Tax=Frankliniella fusca TaxID=407009 RepID=A0AAE1HFU5_9NEOP|nr:Zinc finger and BTB domain-containing protein 11 [Frankliniella fusca]